MTDPRRTQGGKVSGPETPQQEPAERTHSSRTAGTNHDFAETGEAGNQAHGHPREEPGGPEQESQ